MILNRQRELVLDAFDHALTVTENLMGAETEGELDQMWNGVWIDLPMKMVDRKGYANGLRRVAVLAILLAEKVDGSNCG